MPPRDDYVDVAERIVEFRDKYPDGRLRPLDPRRPYAIEEIEGRTFVVYCAAAYRTPDDPLPGIGTAWEPFPGPTPFTRDSELQNAETSAWGRAIVAALIADTKRGIATRQDVDARSGSDESGPRLATDSQIRTLEREVETRGLAEGMPWPIPRDPRPTMFDVSRWIGAVRTRPRETPKPERVSTFRRDLETAAGATDPAPATRDAGETLPGDGGGIGEVSDSRPWERRSFPFDADGPTIGRLWRTWIAAIPGVGPVKLLNAAREIATDHGLQIPNALSEVSDPELVNAVCLWMSNRADERS